MATVVGITADRAEEIEDASVVSGAINEGNGHLILTTGGGTQIDAGVARPDAAIAAAVLVETNNRIADVNAAIPIGSITMFGGAAAPTEYLICDGTAVSRTTYAGLFAVIGIAFGAGNGTTTFNLPNLKSRFPIGLDAAVGGNDAIGETGGVATNALTTAELPAHTHTGTTGNQSAQHAHNLDIQYRDDMAAATGAVNSVSDIENTAGGGGTSVQATGDVSTTNHNHAFTTASAGTGAAFSNLPPYLTLNFIIKAF